MSTTAAPTAPQPQHADRRPGRVRRLDARLATRFVPIVVVLYLLCRFVSFLMIRWVATQQDPAGIPNGPENGHTVDYFDMTRIWDGEWYRRIAEDGYPQELPRNGEGELQQNEWAFYPLFPMLVRLFMAITGGSFAVVASTLALLLGAGAMVVIATLVKEHVGAFVAICTVAVLSASPPSPTFQLAYTESLALLLLSGFLLAVSRQRWGVAIVLALATGLARPVALPLGLVALVAVIMRWRERQSRPIATGEYLRMAGALVSCGLSGLMWPAIAGWRTGESRAYTDTMATWRAGGEIVPFAPWLDNLRLALGEVRGPLLLAVAVALILVAMLGPWASGVGVVMRTWTLGYLLYLGAVLDAWTSTYRYLLFAFPLIIVMIGGGWRPSDERSGSWRFVGLRAVVLVLLGIGWQLWWIWELLRLEPPADYPI
ncbi:hypothetical protein ACMYYO_04165 [Dermacoccaceae bacterium W4C1]